MSIKSFISIIPYTRYCSNFLTNDYHTDDIYLYYQGKRIAGVKPINFLNIGFGYGINTYAVFFKGNKIHGADINSFKIQFDGYAIDKYNAYYNGVKYNVARHMSSERKSRSLSRKTRTPTKRRSRSRSPRRN